MSRFSTSQIVSLVALVLAGTTFGGVLLAAPAPAPAPTTPDAAIAARVAGFKAMGSAMKVLGEQVKSGVPDAAALSAAAQTIAATAPGQAALFPENSGPSSGLKTEALANIWTDRATFDAQLAKLVTESAKLVAITKAGDPAAIGEQVKATGSVCGGCHRQFRADS